MADSPVHDSDPVPDRLARTGRGTVQRPTPTSVPTADLAAAPARRRPAVRLTTKRRDLVALWALRLLGHRRLPKNRHRDAFLDEVLETSGLPMATDDLDAARLHQLARKDSQVLDERGPDRSAELLQNVATLARIVDLDPVEQDVLAFAVAAAQDSGLGHCLRVTAPHGLQGVTALCRQLAIALHTTPGRVRSAIHGGGTLARVGLLRTTARGLYQGEPFEVPDRVSELLTGRTLDRDTLLRHFLQPAPPTALTREDYAHVAADFALVERYLRAALRAKRPGANVLLHGPPGTGKTELVRLLAQEIGAHLHEVRVAGGAGQPLDREDRFASYNVCQRFLQGRQGALVLFDEVEDVLPDDTALLAEETHDKGWINRQLEENPVPAVWITNRAGAIDPAFVRRFDLVVAVRVPPLPVRRAMLQRALGDLQVAPACLDRLAAEDTLTPADVARAARVVRAVVQPARGRKKADPAAPVEAQLERALAGHLDLRRPAARASYQFGPGRYDLAWLNTDTNMAKVVRALRTQPQASLCLYGPPGTGKTAFAVHLAAELGRPLLHKKASDLLSKYVGDTEAHIAAMFRQAAADDAVLLLDEADSFLRDRRTADRGWEVTQVNELLVQMEAFAGTFLCATNLIETLDPASFRRFVLKVRFDPLRPEQRVALVRETLVDLGGDDAAEVEDGAVALRGLTPGDVAAVRKRCRLLGETPTAAGLVESLREELRHGRGERGRVGFGG